MQFNESHFSFCPVCGAKLESRALKDQEPLRLICSACKFVFYLDPKVAVCSIVEWDDHIVLTKRAFNPQKGLWVMPGGYVDRGESVEAAALRETEEECGIQTRLTGLHGLYSYAGNWVVLVVYRALYISGELSARDETLEAKLFEPSQIPWDELAFDSTRDSLRDYCKLKGVALA
ncbi:MAG: NUDIX domain-containing protein [Desulfobacteraceae bacterium]|nr:MAG: NUDIX domain-containing protein [Desulfobacteraceae bacterium]